MNLDFDSPPACPLFGMCFLTYHRNTKWSSAQTHIHMHTKAHSILLLLYKETATITPKLYDKQEI